MGFLNKVKISAPSTGAQTIAAAWVGHSPDEPGFPVEDVQTAIDLGYFSPDDFKPGVPKPTIPKVEGTSVSNLISIMKSKVAPVEGLPSPGRTANATTLPTLPIIVTDPDGDYKLLPGGIAVKSSIFYGAIAASILAVLGIIFLVVKK